MERVAPMEAARRSRQTQRRMQDARAAAGPRGARPSTLLRAQGRLMASGTLSLTPSTKELQFALDRWERRNDSDASSRSTHNFSHKSLEPSERGSDDCPILRRFVHRRTHDAESQVGISARSRRFVSVVNSRYQNCALCTFSLFTLQCMCSLKGKDPELHTGRGVVRQALLLGSSE